MDQVLQKASILFHIAIFSIPILAAAGETALAQPSFRTLLSPGDLLVSDIVIGEDPAGNPVTALELTNLSGQPVELDGLEIRKGEERFLIRNPYVVEPLGKALLSGRAAGPANIRPDVVLEGFHLPPDWKIELRQGEVMITQLSWLDFFARSAALPLADRKIEVGLPADRSWVLLGNPWLEPLDPEEMQAVGGDLESRVVQVWDPSVNSFHLLLPDEKISPGQGFVVKNRDATALRLSRPEDVRDLPSSEASFWISFRLERAGEEENREQVADLATRLFFHKESSRGVDPLDSEKLWPLFRTGSGLGASLLYFIDRTDKTGEEEPRYLAQDARSATPEEPFQVLLGHVAWNRSGPHQLEWELHPEIPENWELLLTDLHTGVSADLRSERLLHFEPAADRQIRPPLTGDPRIHPLRPDEPQARFVLTVNPGLARFRAEERAEGEPDQVELYQNYPNPFNSTTTIDFFLPEEMSVVVSVYNIVGQRVATLREGGALEGGRRHAVEWDAAEIPSGIYIVRLETGNRVLTRKMTLVK